LMRSSATKIRGGARTHLAFAFQRRPQRSVVMQHLQANRAALLWGSLYACVKAQGQRTVRLDPKIMMRSMLAARAWKASQLCTGLHLARV
jgi:hypothetical protein